MIAFIALASLSWKRKREIHHDAKRLELPGAIDTAQAGAIVSWLDRSYSALCAERARRPPIGWPLFANHFEDDELGVELRLITVDLDDRVVCRVMTPAQWRVRLHHVRDGTGNRILADQLPDRFELTCIVVENFHSAV